MRLQLALNVSDIDESVEFYSKMFETEPVKVKPGYANFAIENPPLKLVLFEDADAGGSLNHLGVEVETGEQVEAAEARIAADGIATSGVDATECCYAAKTETWVQGPDNKWEWYVKDGDVDAPEFVSMTTGSPCCPSESVIGEDSAAATAAAPAAGRTSCC